MKLKDKIKSYSFWVSIASAVILILKVLGNRFNFVVDESMVSDIFTALCSVLVLMGIIVVPNASGVGSKNNDDLISNHYFNETSNAETATNNCKQQDSFGEQNNLCQKDVKIESITILNDNQIAQSEYNDVALKNETASETLIQNEESIKKEVLQSINYNDMAEKTEQSFNADNQVIENSFSEKQNDEIKNETLCVNDISTIDSLTAENNFDAPANGSVSNINNNDFEDTTKTNNNYNDSNSDNTDNQNEAQEQINSVDFKELFETNKEKFSGNLNEYLNYIQEEIKKLREKM